MTADANRIGVKRVSAPSSSLTDDVKAACASDADAKQLLNYASAPSDEARRKLAPHIRARAHRLSCARRTATIQRSGRRCDSHRRAERL
ncbi:hypothetical protein PI125_g25535 [Phytophthora idaei]|nr:hypothetical protein PI125_g25535 [Phytophthora idaei]KAG3124145.1 hypothetical protein PI126_g23382 [Phytophthora idaei]